MDKQRGLFRHAQHLLALLLFFGSTKIALSDTGSTAPPTVRDLNVSDIVVPADLGYIVETHPATANAPLIIHIQEAHVNYEGQKHLAAILQHLVEQYGLRLILVEGGEGNGDLANLRAFGGPEIRKRVAEEYLQLGVLNGEEYLDIVSDYPLVLWGIERQGLYQENIEAFLEAERLGKTLRPIAAAARGAVDALKPALLDPALRELQAKEASFAQEQMGLGEYADYLVDMANRYGLREEAYPNVTRFHAARQLERAIDTKQVQQEQNALMQRLPASALEEVNAKARQLQAGAIPRAVFYATLERQAAASALSLEPYPQLARYLAYMKQNAQLNPQRLAQELDQLATDVAGQIPLSPPGRQLQSINERLALLEQLIDLKLSPAEYERLTAWPRDTFFEGWEGVLQGRSVPPLAPLQQAMPQLLRFYALAQTRDAAMVERALAKMGESNQRLAVLITGGFHAQGIAQELQRAGVGVVVVTPKTTQATNDELYHAVLKYKSGHARFEEVEAVAARTAGAPTQR